MTEVEPVRNAMHWENGSSNVNNIADMDEDLEDLENNSAKLFERSRIKALAGVYLYINSLLDGISV